APMQAPVPMDQAETSVATTPANVEGEDISLAPTMILTPQEMMAYHARRWQREMEQEQAHGQQAAAATAEQQNATDIADLPTLRAMPVVVPPASTTPANVETPAIAANDIEAQPVA